ncbi:MAG TPA: tetratricopeptide repeat protein [Pyrinomonadaceae bacterium]|nr:tetratricopeptide repeat protein [Pyrinomonadaceae bacterium]
MQRSIILGIGGVVVGLVIGFYGANALNRQQPTTTADPGQTVDPQVADQATAPGGVQSDVNDTLQKAEGEPQNFAAQMKAGDMYAQISRFDKAVEFYKRGILINPGNFQANIVLANALFDSQKFEEAEGYYAKALQIDPKDINARTDLGTTFVERSSPDYPRAITEFRKALEIDPKHAPALYYLGIAYLRKGDKDEANKALGELEKANPTSDLISRLKQNLDAQ